MTTDGGRKLEERCVNALRFLAVDAVERAHSGHPGLPMGAAAMAHVLWTRHLRHHPGDPAWANRDRFVLSAGHGSALLYGLLHLAGYEVTLEDLQAFRQWGSVTPGHPESNVTRGVEVTTGPLGQGLAMAVGMATAEAHLAARFNRPGHELVDHRTYALVSDGDLMEGVAYEASALAGHLRLGKLIVLYDANDVTLAGSWRLSSSERVAARFDACGWDVTTVEDGNDLDAVDEALSRAAATDRPSLLAVRTVLGYGARNVQGTHNAHGAPLGAAEVAAAKAELGWPTEPSFYVPEEVRARYAAVAAAGASRAREWSEALVAYRAAHPAAAAELERRLRGDLPQGWASDLPAFPPDEKGVATRRASEAVLQRLADAVPEMIGGSADLNPSTFTWLKGKGDFQAPVDGESAVATDGAVGEGWGYDGRNLHFGVREHAMGAMANGMAIHGGVIPFTGTFLVFSDYMRPAIRLAALGGYPAIFVFTHDSVAVGEDGPTHQPVEQLMGLRSVPELVVVRPGDANETAVAWRVAVERRDGPTALVFSRQALPVLDRGGELATADGLARGGYVLWDASPDRSPELLLIGTGAEIHVALSAGRRLATEGVRVRVVSLPSFELFAAQPEAYRRRVLPETVCARVAVEAGISLGWERFVGAAGSVVGVDRFGASAPGPEVLRRYGITEDEVVARGREQLERTR